MEPRCLRCGKCCHWIEGTKIVKCHFLIPQKDGKTLCRVYNTRLGRVLKTVGKESVVCTTTKDRQYNQIGCPFNSLNPNKPMFEEVI